MSEGARTDAFLTVQDLATRLSVPPATIYTWNFYGRGPRYLKVGRLCRYRLADVEAWENGLAVGGSANPADQEHK